MENTNDPLAAGIETAFVALTFTVFAIASRFLDDPRLATGKADEGGMGMLYYERYESGVHFRNPENEAKLSRLQRPHPTIHISRVYSTHSRSSIHTDGCIPMFCQLSTSSLAVGRSRCPGCTGSGSTRKKPFALILGRALKAVPYQPALSTPPSYSPDRKGNASQNLVGRLRPRSNVRSHPRSATGH